MGVNEVVSSVVIGLCCFFFFSSRRRHTRLQGDWSSDVCSSDLRCLALDTLSLMCVSKRSLFSFAALRYLPLVLGVITVPSRESCSILCLLPICTPDAAISIGLSFRPTFETGRQTRAFKRDKSGQGRTVG